MIGTIIGLGILALCLLFVVWAIYDWHLWNCCEEIFEVTITGHVDGVDEAGFGGATIGYCSGYINSEDHTIKYIIEGKYGQPCPYDVGDVIEVKKYFSKLVIWQ